MVHDVGFEEDHGTKISAVGEKIAGEEVLVVVDALCVLPGVYIGLQAGGPGEGAREPRAD